MLIIKSYIAIIIIKSLNKYTEIMYVYIYIYIYIYTYIISVYLFKDFIIIIAI